VSSNILSRGEEKSLTHDVDALAQEEKELDRYIAYMSSLVKSYSKSPHDNNLNNINHKSSTSDGGSGSGGSSKNPWMYVTKDELTSLSSLVDDTVIAIRAPAGTMLDVPDPDEGMQHGTRRFQMFLKSPNEENVDVFLVQYGSVQKKKMEGETEDQALISARRKGKRPHAAQPESTVSNKRIRHDSQEASPNDNQDDMPLPYYPSDPYSPANAASSATQENASANNASYYASWEKYIPETSKSSPTNSNSSRLSSREQRDEHNGDTSASNCSDGTASHGTEADCDGFGSPPRNHLPSASPRFQRELEPSSSSSVVSHSDHSHSAAHPNSPLSPLAGDEEEMRDEHQVPLVSMKGTALGGGGSDSSGGGSFDFMDPSFDDALLNAGAQNPSFDDALLNAGGFFGAELSSGNTEDFLNFHATS